MAAASAPETTRFHSSRIRTTARALHLCRRATGIPLGMATRPCWVRASTNSHSGTSRRTSPSCARRVCSAPTTPPISCPACVRVHAQPATSVVSRQPLFRTRAHPGTSAGWVPSSLSRAQQAPTHLARRRNRRARARRAPPASSVVLAATSRPPVRKVSTALCHARVDARLASRAPSNLCRKRRAASCASPTSTLRGVGRARAFNAHSRLHGAGTSRRELSARSARRVTT
mmetsp:Transcript_13970/g.42610  ORF Transcript_13970/g.42610 Transcript_13970/m.42610 type:complete len:230 (-) Transcript_13970:3056-3745(-)